MSCTNCSGLIRAAPRFTAAAKSAISISVLRRRRRCRHRRSHPVGDQGAARHRVDHGVDGGVDLGRNVVDSGVDEVVHQIRLRVDRLEHAGIAHPTDKTPEPPKKKKKTTKTERRTGGPGGFWGIGSLAR